MTINYSSLACQNIARILPVAGLLGVFGLSSIFMPACTSGLERRYANNATLASPAARLAQGRQASLLASATATKAAKAEKRGDLAQANRLRTEAIEQYRDALRISNEIPEAWNNLGVLLMKQRDYLAAADAFSFAIDQSPTDPRPCENLGLVYSKTGWSEDALKYYNQALDRNPNRLQALRGAIKSAHLLGLGDAKDLDRVQRALMLEKDESWRQFFMREKLRIKGRLDSKRTHAKS